MVSPRLYIPSRMRPHPSQVPNSSPLQPCATPLSVMHPPDDTPAPTSTIPLPSPYQTRQYIRVKNRMLNHPKVQHHTMPPHPTPRVPNEPVPHDPAPRVRIQHHLPTPYPRLYPKKTAPDHPIARRTRYHRWNAQPPVDLSMPVFNSETVESL